MYNQYKMAFLGAQHFTTSLNDDQDPDLKYFNATIINSSRDRSGHVDPSVRFNETRDTPIVKDSSKYNFSIIRFTMNGCGRDLPLFIPVIRTGAENPTNDVNLTIYTVSVRNAVSYNDGAGNTLTQTFTSSQPVIYSPETLDATQAPVPSSAALAVSGQDISTRYYWVYTYSHWLKLCNQAFEACMTDIQAQFAAAWTAAGYPGSPVLRTTAPVLTYNPTTNLFSLLADRWGFGDVDRYSLLTSPLQDESCTVYFNANMYGLFANFYNEYVNLAPELTNKIFTGSILFQNIQTIATGSPAGVTPAAVTYPAPFNPGSATEITERSYWVMVQESPSTGQLWSPVEAIVFTSSLLPLVNEETGDPVRFGSGNLGTNSSSLAAFEPIVTDIALSPDNAYAYKQFIEYVPTGEYRLSSFLRSQQPINNIDIQVFWRCRLDNKLYPVQMFNGSSVSIKCLFRRRGFSNVPHPQQYGFNA